MKNAYNTSAYGSFAYVYDIFMDIKVVTGVKPFDELIAEIEEKLKA